jgi:hypothetical protein
MSEKICEICSNKISLSDHLFGLVFQDNLFICQDCTKKHTHEEIRCFTKTTMQNPINGMPIGLWLIHEQNKNKTMMTVKK